MEKKQQLTDKIDTDKMCHYKTFAGSFSIEGLAYKLNFPDIDFYQCDYNCNGYDIKCRDYFVKEKNDDNGEEIK